MLDFNNLVVEKVTEGAVINPNLALIMFVFAGILAVLGLALFARGFESGAFLILAAALGLMSGLIAKDSELQNVVVRIQPTVENLEQMVNGKTIVKKGEDYFFIDTLSRKDLKELQSKNRLNEALHKDFKETWESLK